MTVRDGLQLTPHLGHLRVHGVLGLAFGDLVPQVDGEAGQGVRRAA